MAKISRSSVGRLISQELLWCQDEFFRGNRGIIFHAIRQSCRYGVPLPDLLMEELIEALHKRTNYRAESLDEALGIDELPGKGADKMLRWYGRIHGGRSLIELVIARLSEIERTDLENGRKSKRTVNRKQVAEEFKLSERTVLAMTNAHDKAIENLKPLDPRKV